MGCDRCISSYCESCIEHNLGGEHLHKVKNTADWGCYSCDPTPTSALRWDSKKSGTVRAQDSLVSILWCSLTVSLPWQASKKKSRGRSTRKQPKAQSTEAEPGHAPPSAQSISHPHLLTATMASTTLSFTTESLEEMNYRELQACAKAHGAKANGKAVQLKLRLSAMLEKAAGPLAEIQANSPTKAFKEFTKGAGPVHESPMKVDTDASPTQVDASDKQLEVGTDGSVAPDAAELPSPIDEDTPKFPNDGTFLDMFKATEKEQQEQPWEMMYRRYSGDAGAAAGDAMRACLTPTACLRL
eukprot:COSAG02_NODE_9073_length_2341_cov_7.577163_3_plen_298_part_01